MRLVLALALGCSTPEAPTTAEGAPPSAAQAPTRPNVVFVSIDTVRADHLGSYGYQRDTSPWLDALAERGVLFEQAVSTSSWTPPAMASMVTGVYPAQHGVVVAADLDERMANLPALSGELVTLAEHLKGAGWTTWALTASSHLTEERGFAQGVDFFKAIGMVDDARRLMKEVEAAQAGIRSRGPWMLWIHILDPHGPYWQNEPHASHFDQELEEAFPGSAEGREERLEELRVVQVRPRFTPADVYTAGSLELETLKVLYDSEIRFTDDVLSRLGELFPPGDDTLWVVSSDHGEEFRDHGGLQHRQPLYEHQLRVPWVVAWPGVIEPARISAPVSTASLMPTVVELATGRAPVVPQGGAPSLAPVLRGSAPVPDEPLFADVIRGQERERAVRWGELKLRLPHEGAPVLVDLAADPGERAPLQDPEAVARLRQAWSDWEQRAVVLPPVDVNRGLSPEEEEQLRAMGYLDE